jgi:hypothetical protein
MPSPFPSPCPALPRLEYDVLATVLKAVLEGDDSAFNAERLEALTVADLKSWFGDNDMPLLVRLGSPAGALYVTTHATPIPILVSAHAGCCLQEERVAKLQELGYALRSRFAGWAINMVAQARGSAAALVDTITSMLPGMMGVCVWLPSSAGSVFPLQRTSP